MAKLCVALDVEYSRAREFLKSLSGLPIVVKVGPKLFLEAGRDICNAVKEEGFELFLDLKLHDIPNTVRLAVEQAQKIGADYLTLHTLGGREMLREAVSAGDSINLLGVTLLTSHDEEYMKFLKSTFSSVEDMVIYLAKQAHETGLDGVVCSAGEVRKVKEKTSLFTVVPGIRLSSRRHDQKRVYGPREAVKEGADMIVMGRDIYLSSEPKKVVEDVLNLILSAEN